MSESFLINNSTEKNEGDDTMDEDPNECAEDSLLNLDGELVSGGAKANIAPDEEFKNDIRAIRKKLGRNI